VVANYLPPNSGSGGAGYNFIMVGTDDDDVARIGATVKAINVPFGSTVQVRIAYKDPSTGDIVPIGSMDSYSGETALLSASIYNTGPGYFLVAWIDDGSGYNPTDVQDDTSNRWTIYFVAEIDYEAAANYLNNARIGGGFLHTYPWASAFVGAFLSDEPVDGADNSYVGTVTDTEKLLHHNTGVVWNNGSPPYGNIVINEYYAPGTSPSQSDLSATILANSDFVNKIITTLTESKPTVQGYNWHDDPNPTHTFSIRMRGDVNFTHGDLHFAIGHGHLQNCILHATVRKSDLQLTQLNIAGTLYDYFDFDVDAHPDPHLFSRNGAEVQAGYNPGNGLTYGHVFYTQATLDQTNLPITFNFGP
jgi:hypothetical protein